MIPSEMNLKIRLGTVRYINKILVSDGKFILGNNEKVNLVVPAMKNHKTNSLETPAIKNHKTNSIKPTTITTSQGLTHTPAIFQKNKKHKTITHSDENIALVLAPASGFAIWNIFR